MTSTSPTRTWAPSGTRDYVAAATAWLGAFPLPGDGAPGDPDHARFGRVGVGRAASDAVSR